MSTLPVPQVDSLWDIVEMTHLWEYDHMLF